MKRQHTVLLGGAALLLAFLVAGYLYRAQQAQKVSTLTQQSASPLVRDDAKTKGPMDAKVVLVEFFDPACETCRAFSPHVKSLLDSHPGKIRLVLRYAPFHPGSDVMVKILEASRKQEKYWEVLDVMYDTQPQWASHHHPQPEKIWQFLPSAGVDVDKLRRDMDDPKFQKIVDRDIADGKALGVRKTPQFFVNDKPLLSFGLPQLKAMIDLEVAAQYGAEQGPR